MLWFDINKNTQGQVIRKPLVISKLESHVTLLSIHILNHDDFDGFYDKLKIDR